MSEQQKQNFEKLWEKYNSLPGWLTKSEARILYECALNVPDGKNIVEIGSWKGKSASFIGSAIKFSEKKNTKLFCIDPFTGSEEHQVDGQKVWTFDVFKQNIKDAGVDDVVEVVQGYSQDVISKAPKSFGMIFIDGDHSYKGVKQDYDLYNPRLEDNGYILFHDTVWWRGVHKLMNEVIFFNKDFTDVEWAGSIIKAKKTKRTFGGAIKSLYIYSIQQIYFILGFIKAKTLGVKKNNG